MKIINADCLLAMKEMPDNSVDAIVTDPPYGLSFMGKKWDYDVPSQEIWKECLRVLKPGGYLLAFAGTRTQHRMAVRIEDAGFEIRDMIAWIYGSGFPKSLNIGKAVDKLLGNEREVVGKTQSVQFQEKGYEYKGKAKGSGFQNEKYWGFGNDVTKGTSEWEGWGTALKPALEPITVARKPIEGNVAQNCLKWGVGGINIDGCRVGTEERTYNLTMTSGNFETTNGGKNVVSGQSTVSGRFPANLITDGSDEVVGLFPQTKGGNFPDKRGNSQLFGDSFGNNQPAHKMEGGSAARFFYCAKASKSERNRGCEDMEDKESKKMDGGKFESASTTATNRTSKNFHPTVKPIALMEYLVKLVSKEGHTVLDPFMGSGSTGIACKKLGREFIGIEKENDYCKIAEARIGAVQTVQEKLYD